MNVELKKVNDLSEAEWSLWAEFQESSAVYESPYFRPEFTRCVAAVRTDVEIGILREGSDTVGFFPFQRGKLNLGKPIGGKLSDYHGPIVRSGTKLDPLAILEQCQLASWDFDHLVCAAEGFEPFTTLKARSPRLDLNDGYEAYLQGRKAARSDSIHRQGQKTRKLAREVGPLQFAFNADDEEAFKLLSQWKSEQLVRSQLTDVFAFPWIGQLLADLRQQRGETFFAPLTVLRAGDKVAAICLSLVSRGVLHSWFTAYNPELSSYSPGMTLFVSLAEQARSFGIRTIDLGRGEERYKWSLASSSVELSEGTISRPSMGTLLRDTWRTTRDWVAKSPLAGTTGLLKPVREWIAYQ